MKTSRTVRRLFTSKDRQKFIKEIRAINIEKLAKAILGELSGHSATGADERPAPARKD